MCKGWVVRTVGDVGFVSVDVRAICINVVIGHFCFCFCCFRNSFKQKLSRNALFEMRSQAWGKFLTVPTYFYREKHFCSECLALSDQTLILQYGCKTCVKLSSPN